MKSGKSSRCICECSSGATKPMLWRWDAALLFIVLQNMWSTIFHHLDPRSHTEPWSWDLLVNPAVVRQRGLRRR